MLAKEKRLVSVYIDAEIEELLRWADVIHCLDDVPPAVAEMGKPIFVTYNGSRYRANWEQMSRQHQEMGVKRQFCTSIDLSRFGAEWMPIPMAQLPQAEPYTGGVFRVVQAPTVRERKRTDKVMEQLSGVDGVALMMLDVLSQLSEIKICVAYEMDGKQVKHFPCHADDLRKVTPIYETLPGWEQDVTGVRQVEDLPQRARDYIQRISELLKRPVEIVSVGPDREQTMFAPCAA